MPHNIIYLRFSRGHKHMEKQRGLNNPNWGYQGIYSSQKKQVLHHQTRTSETDNLQTQIYGTDHHKVKKKASSVQRTLPNQIWWLRVSPEYPSGTRVLYGGVWARTVDHTLDHTLV